MPAGALNDTIACQNRRRFVVTSRWPSLKRMAPTRGDRGWFDPCQHSSPSATPLRSLSGEETTGGLDWIAAAETAVLSPIVLGEQGSPSASASGRTVCS